MKTKFESITSWILGLGTAFGVLWLAYHLYQILILSW